MSTSPARATAFDVLLRIEKQDAYASELLHSSQYAKLSSADHGLATELHRNPNYHIIDVVPYGPHGTYVIWRYRRHQ